MIISISKIIKEFERNLKDIKTNNINLSRILLISFTMLKRIHLPIIPLYICLKPSNTMTAGLETCTKRFDPIA